MRATELKASATVTPINKKFAILLSVLDTLYSGDREKVIRMLAAWYRVTL